MPLFELCLRAARPRISAGTLVLFGHGQFQAGWGVVIGDGHFDTAVGIKMCLKIMRYALGWFGDLNLFLAPFDLGVSEVLA
ncbi:hypothetical protein C84B14_15226 [Salinisphaera sp. C84B14]